MKRVTLPTILVLGLLNLAFFGSLETASAQTVSIAILNFQDDTGANAPAELGQKLSQDLHRRIATEYKDLLPRLVTSPAASVQGLTLDQLAELAKQNGAKYIVRAGLLTLISEPAGSDSKVTAQLFADIISADNAAIVTTVRSEGSGTQVGTAPLLSSLRVKGASTGVGQAFAGAIAQLAEAIHQAVTGEAGIASTRSDNTQTTSQPDGSQAAAQAAAADQELQQLIAQAEAILAANPNSSTENVNALRQTLEGLKSALAKKAGLLQESKDTSAVDQEIATHKQEIETVLTNLTAEASAANTSTQVQPPTAQKKDFLTRVGEFADEAMGLLQRIQELRSTLRSVHGDQSAANPAAQNAASLPDGAPQTNQPAEETIGEVSGVVTSDGSPVEGAVVTNQETGESATSDTSGAFNLKGLIAGRLSQLIVTKNGRLIGRGQVDLPNGRAAIADFQIRSLLAEKTSVVALPGVLASTVVSAPAKHPGVSTGSMKGEIRDSSARPVPFALVQVPGIGMARTNALGQYTFINVPVGTYQLTVRRSGIKPKSAQVTVAANTSTVTRIGFVPADAIVSSRRSLFMAGAGTALRGTVIDEQTRPLSNAKISVIQSDTTVSVLTESNGTYEVRNLKPGSYRVSVFRVGYQVASQALTLGAAVTAHCDFQLTQVASASVTSLIRNASAKQQGEIRGTLQTLTGAPIANASIEVRSAGKASLLTRTSTNTRGEYALKLAEGTYDLKGKEPSFQDGAHSVSVRAGISTRQDFVLMKAAASTIKESSGQSRAGIVPATNGQVSGRVIDGKTGAPIAGVTVSIVGHRTFTTGTNGSYSFTNLVPGTYQITAKKGGFAEAQKSVTIRAEDTVAVNFALKSTSVPPIRIPARP